MEVLVEAMVFQYGSPVNHFSHRTMAPPPDEMALIEEPTQFPLNETVPTEVEPLVTVTSFGTTPQEH
jgi:hypothetical protein